LFSDPSHITVIDEIGRYLDAVKTDKNNHLTDAQTQMMEIFGRAGKPHFKAQYATLNLTQAHRDAVNENPYVMSPSLTVVGMSVPGRFYEALTSREIVDGFLPRYLVVETESGRIAGIRKKRNVEISGDLIEWMKDCAYAMGESAEEPSGGAEVKPPQYLNDPTLVPNPVVIRITDSAMRVLDEFDDELIKRANYLEHDGIGELLGKTREITHRIALIVAVSDESEEILECHAQWAVDYVKYYTYQMVDKVKLRVANSDFEIACKQVCVAIKSAGPMGLTLRDLSKKSPLYRGMDDRKRTDIITVLKDDGEIVPVEFKTAGRPRVACCTFGTAARVSRRKRAIIKPYTNLLF